MITIKSIEPILISSEYGDGSVLGQPLGVKTIGLVKITSSIVITESEMVTLVSQGAVLLNIASSGKDFDWYFEQFKATNITPDIQKIEELWFEDFIQEHKSLKTHIITFSDRLSEAVSGACFLRNVGLKSQSFAINQ